MDSILEIFWLFVLSWTRRQGNISGVFASLTLLNRLRALPNSLIFFNKSEHKDAEKLNDALVGMDMAQLQNFVANTAKHTVEEKNAEHCLD